MEYISAVLGALLLVACLWWFYRKYKRKVKMEAMIKRTQKVCQARLAENKAETQKGE